MPTPQEILSDPNFQNLSIGDQLTVMRKADPNFAALSKTDQGTVIAKSRQRFLGTDKIGQRLADNPNMGTPEPSMEPGLPGQPSQDFIGGLKDIASGNVSRGLHKEITGAGKIGTMALPLAVVSAPLATAGSLAFGYAGSKAGKAGTSALGASEDQSDLAGDIAGIAAGSAGAKYGDRALRSFGSVFKAPEWLNRFRNTWNELGNAKASGRTPGGINDPRTISPASTAKKLPADVEPIPHLGSVPTSGPILIGKTPSERLMDVASSREGTVGTRAEMMRQLRLAGKYGYSDAQKEAIMRRFSSPEYTPRPNRGLLSPETPVPATETPVVQSGPVIPAQSAAELLKTAGIDADAVAKATPEQWKLIEKHVGAAVDREATIDQLRSMESLADYKKRIARSRAKFDTNGKRQ